MIGHVRQLLSMMRVGTINVVSTCALRILSGHESSEFICDESCVYAIGSENSESSGCASGITLARPERMCANVERLHESVKPELKTHLTRRGCPAKSLHENSVMILFDAC